MKKTAVFTEVTHFNISGLTAFQNVVDRHGHFKKIFFIWYVDLKISIKDLHFCTLFNYDSFKLLKKIIKGQHFCTFCFTYCFYWSLTLFQPIFEAFKENNDKNSIPIGSMRPKFRPATLLKRKSNFPHIYSKFRVEQLQSHIWRRAS